MDIPICDCPPKDCPGHFYINGVERKPTRAFLDAPAGDAMEICHLKDCGREAVIGTMKVWGPEYRVAMCEHHVMERMRRIAPLESREGELVAALKKDVVCASCHYYLDICKCESGKRACAALAQGKGVLE